MFFRTAVLSSDCLMHDPTEQRQCMSCHLDEAWGNASGLALITFIEALQVSLFSSIRGGILL